jgi:hypothetical protein
MSKRNKFVDDHNVDHLLPLVGGVITKVLVDEGDGNDETCYGIAVEKNGTQYECLIMCDPEGNGPGHLYIWKDK